jgi:hypothetical protein
LVPELLFGTPHAAALLQEFGPNAPAPNAAQAPQNGGRTAPVFPRAVLRPNVFEHAAGPQ